MKTIYYAHWKGWSLRNSWIDGMMGITSGDTGIRSSELGIFACPLEKVHFKDVATRGVIRSARAIARARRKPPALELVSVQSAARAMQKSTVDGVLIVTPKGK